jgi:hypothetical protein
MTQLTVTRQGFAKSKPGPKQSLDLSIARFWSKVNQDSGRFGCWPWMGSRKEKGYGQTYFMGRNIRAHRLAYELEYGPVPNGLFVCHFCDNPSCCNPWHLVAATAKDNTQDMISKGRDNFINNLPKKEKQK